MIRALMTGTLDRFLSLLVLLCLSLPFLVAGTPYTIFFDSYLGFYFILLGIGAFILGRSSNFKFLNPFFLALLTLAIGILFLKFTDGRILFSDDHPSFLYRFQLLRQHFPAIPFYNPAWNAGYSAREFFPSGMLNCFFLASPLIYFFGDLSSWSNLVVYNYIIVWLFIFIVPFSLYFSIRALGFSVRAATIGGILSLVPSLSYFEWLLKYGTLGFVLSAAFLPLTLSFICRFVFSDKRCSFWDMLILLVVSFFCISWTLMGLLFVPLVFLSIIKIAYMKDWRRVVFVLGFALLFVGLNGPWIKIFVEESKVLSFLDGNSLPGASTVSSAAGGDLDLEAKALAKNRLETLEQLRNNINKANPLLLVLFIPAVLILPGFWLKTVFGSLAIWIVCLSWFGGIYKPQLELSRMILPFCFLSIVPVSIAFDRLLAKVEVREGGRILAWPGFIYSLIAVSILGHVLLMPVIAVAAWSNRTDERFVLQRSGFRELSQALVEHAGSGKTFFLGFVLHELGSSHGISQDGGHIAPLASMSGKPLYSSDFYHTRWSSVDPVPEVFRDKSSEGVEEFLDLVGASAVVTAKREWIQYCERDPRYKKVYSGRHFTMFSRQTDVDLWFLEGSGELELLSNGFRVKPTEDRLVVKLRYLPKLKCFPESACEVKPKPAFREEIGKSKTQDVDFIEILVNPDFLKVQEFLKVSY